MQKDKGFRRRVVTLIIVVLLTAAVVAVYLAYGVHSRSNLPLIVPKNVTWFYHFQSRSVDEAARKSADSRPLYYDSFYYTLVKLPVLHNVKDAGQPGIYLMTDIVLFADSKGWYTALTVTSEEKLNTFCKDNVPADLVEKPVEKPEFTYVKSKTRNLYFAYKHKACVFYVPSDTSLNIAAAEEALKAVFTQKDNSIYNNKALQHIYDKDCQIVFWGEGIGHGVHLDAGYAQFHYTDSLRNSRPMSPLYLFNQAGIKYSESEVERILTKNNQIKSREYLNQTFRAMYYFLKPFVK
ncbi:MAG: hypothetical protein ACKO6I_00290 [Sphingomonadales bacterium]